MVPLTPSHVRAWSMSMYQPNAVQADAVSSNRPPTTTASAHPRGQIFWLGVKHPWTIWPSQASKPTARMVLVGAGGAGAVQYGEHSPGWVAPTPPPESPKPPISGLRLAQRSSAHANAQLMDVGLRLGFMVPDSAPGSLGFRDADDPPLGRIRSTSLIVAKAPNMGSSFNHRCHGTWCASDPKVGRKGNCQLTEICTVIKRCRPTWNLITDWLPCPFGISTRLIGGGWYCFALSCAQLLKPHFQIVLELLVPNHPQAVG